MSEKKRKTAEKRPVRPSAVVRIVIWSVVFCLLGGLLTAGFLGVSLFDEDDLLFLFGEIGLRRYTYEDASEYNVGNAEVEDTITDLTINWAAGDVAVTVAEGDKIVVTEGYDGSDRDLRLRWRVEDGELTVQFRKSAWIGLSDTTRKDLTVAIPAAMLEAMGSVSISNATGNVTYEGDADHLDLDVMDGDLCVTGDIGELDVQSAQGDVVFRGGVRDGEIECVDANVTMYLEMAANLSFEQVSGDVCLYLSDEITGFSVELESLNDEIDVDDFENARVDGKTVKWGQAGLRISVDGVKNKLKIAKLTND